MAFPFPLPTRILNLLDSYLKHKVYPGRGHYSDISASGPTSPATGSPSVIHLSKTASYRFKYNPKSFQKGPTPRTAGLVLRSLWWQRRLSGAHSVGLTWWAWWSEWQTTACSLCGSSEQKGQTAAGACGSSPLLWANRGRRLAQASVCAADTLPGAPSLMQRS